MLGLLLLALAAAWALYQKQTIAEVALELPSRVTHKLDRLWDIAQESLKDN